MKAVFVLTHCCEKWWDQHVYIQFIYVLDKVENGQIIFIKV